MVKRVSNEQREAVKELLRRGVGITEIARRSGISRVTIYKIRDLILPHKPAATAYNVIGTRLSDAEFEELDKMAREMGLSRSALVRRLVCHAADFATIAEEDSRFLTDSLSRIAKLGRDFNQIAKALSEAVIMTGKAEPSEMQRQQIMNARNEVGEIKNVVRQLIKNGQTRRNALMHKLASPIRDDDDD